MKKLKDKKVIEDFKAKIKENMDKITDIITITGKKQSTQQQKKNRIH